MKKTIIAIAILLAGTLSFGQTKQDSTSKQQHRGTTAQKYTCPMHPEVVKSKPGKCPKCGMTLVPMKKKTKNAKPMGDMKM